MMNRLNINFADDNEEEEECDYGGDHNGNGTMFGMFKLSTRDEKGDPDRVCPKCLFHDMDLIKCVRCDKDMGYLLFTNEKKRSIASGLCDACYKSFRDRVRLDFEKNQEQLDVKKRAKKLKLVNEYLYYSFILHRHQWCTCSCLFQ